MAASRAAAPVLLQLPYAGPYDWDAMLAFLAARAIPGVEAVVGTRYLRSFALGKSRGVLDVQPSGRGGKLRASVRGTGEVPEPLVAARLRHLFDLDADAHAIDAHLGRDPLFAERVRLRPGVRVPGAWDPFELAVRAVLGQQVTVAAATLFSGRLAQACGVSLSPAAGTHPATPRLLFPEPARLADFDFARIGLTRARGETLRGLARTVDRDAFWLSPRQSLAAALADLVALRGIGPWTAHYIAMRAMREPDAFPASDLALRRALGNKQTRPSAAKLEAIARPWRPWRAYAAVRLWLQPG